MQLCIFEAGLLPDGFAERFGSYPQMIERWLSPALPEARFSYLSAVRDEPPPEIDAHDGYLISGSRHGVYEDLPWMRTLKGFLRAARAAGKPMFGICFGHQIIADAFGGRVIQSPRGWNIGVQPYRYDDADAPADAPALVFHQDQIVTLPPGARVVGASERCAIGALAYDFPALSVQHHPEFDRAFVDALIERFCGDRVPGELAAPARARLDALPVDSTPIARWAAAFFRAHIQSRAAAG